MGINIPGKLSDLLNGKLPKNQLLIALGIIFLTGLLAGSFLAGGGNHTQKSAASSGDTTGGERKVAYWKAPMNPTEIYDEPGQSAMGMDLVPVYEDELDGGGSSSDANRKIAYWKAPMNPTEIYDKPGQSAMGMDLVPVYEDELIGGVEIKIDPVIQQNMGLRTQRVEQKPLSRTIRTFGHITTDETKTAQISAKTHGWIERLHVNFNGMFVNVGDPLYEIYSPEIVAAQEELLVGVRTSGSGRLSSSAAKRLLYFDVGEEEINALKKSRAVQKTVMIRSPITGFVIAKHIEEGTYVKSGSMIFRIADLSKVWAEAHIYEYELPFIKEGQNVVMNLPYLPGKDFKGKVTYVYPYVQPKTRDVVIRIEFDNPDFSLKPDMYANILIESSLEMEGLVIPSESVIRSGERNIVFITRDNHKFTPRDVILGPALDGGNVQVITGLSPKDIVVTSGQFLLDSESKLKEAIQKMLDAKREKTEPAKKPIADDGFFDDLEKENDDFFKDLEEEKTTNDFFKIPETEDTVK